MLRRLGSAAALLVAVTLLGCVWGGPRTPDPKPLTKGSGPLCSRIQIMPYITDVYLMDNWDHVQWVGYIEQDQRLCTSWTLPGEKGRWGYGDHGQVRWDFHWFEAAQIP